jgi:hypothetical protein
MTAVGGMVPGGMVPGGTVPCALAAWGDETIIAPTAKKKIRVKTNGPSGSFVHRAALCGLSFPSSAHLSNDLVVFIGYLFLSFCNDARAAADARSGGWIYTSANIHNRCTFCNTQLHCREKPKRSLDK